jgi:hypothetical protein
MKTNSLHLWLEQQSKAQLIKLIEMHCDEDGDFLNRLQLKAAARNPARNMERIKKTIQNAFWIEDYVDWREAASYANNLCPVFETLKELLESGEAEAVVELVEEALDCWVEAANCIHDDGEMAAALDELFELHLRACQKAKPDPVELAENLFLTAVTNREWGLFCDAYTVYADLLSTSGKKRYRELVGEKWNKLPKIRPGQKGDTTYDGNAEWLSGLMTQFAREDGDLGRELEILQRDLSSASKFQIIAERFDEEKQPALALEWVEAGLHHFADDLRLQEKCAELYWKAKRRNDALLVWWNLFERQRNLSTYQQLVTHAEKNKKKDVWRDKALAAIRAGIAACNGKTKYYWIRTDRSLLVEIFLWEGDAEQAWKEAQAGGCSTGLWLTLCARREIDYPAEVYPVYLRLAEEAVEKKDNDSYKEAVKRIKKAKELASGCDSSGSFDTMLGKIKLTHKAKRNFISYLTAAGL